MSTASSSQFPRRTSPPIARYPRLRQGLARVWRAGLSRVGCRRRQGRQAHLVPARGEAEAERDRGVRLDHLQVARGTRQDQRQGDGGSAPGENDGPKNDAVRRQADDLWRVCESGEGVGSPLGPHRRAPAVPPADGCTETAGKLPKFAACRNLISPYTLQYKVRGADARSRQGLGRHPGDPQPARGRHGVSRLWPGNDRRRPAAWRLLTAAAAMRCGSTIRPASR